MPRRTCLALLLAAPMLAGCVVPTGPIRLAREGAATTGGLVPVERALAASDRIALFVGGEQRDAETLRHCIARAVASRLPGGGPVPMKPDADAAVRLAAMVSTAEPGGPLPARVAAEGFDWLISVRDATTTSSVPIRNFGFDNAFQGAIGGAVGEQTEYHLSLFARVFDGRSGRALGTLGAYHDTRSSSGVSAGVVAIFVPIPFFVPFAELPAGTSAMAICDAFGRAVGDALVAATAPGR
jgi:hypothetical protein